MPYGTKDVTTVKNGVVKVKYHCHCTLDQIPETVREISASGLLVDIITYEDTTNMWRINYFENISN